LYYVEAHARLLDPEVFTGGVRILEDEAGEAQTTFAV